MSDDNNFEWAKDTARFVNERLKAGQVFLGAVDGGGVVELVFTSPPDVSYNLVTIGGDGVTVGSVSYPEEYVEGTWPVL